MGLTESNKREKMKNYEDGSVYKGPMEEERREGIGTCNYSDRTAYKGEWHRDLRQGEGTLLTNQGYIIETRFEDDHIVGTNARVKVSE